MKSTLVVTALLLAALPICASGKKPVPRPMFSATVQNVPISIFIADRAFDPARHRTTPPRNLGTDEDPKWEAATVDGRDVVGTDEPEAGDRQLAQIAVQFGKRRIDVPKRLLAHVFNPDLSTAKFNQIGMTNTVTISADGRAVLIGLAVGDGEYARTISIYVGIDGTCTDEPVPRHEP